MMGTWSFMVYCYCMYLTMAAGRTNISTDQSVLLALKSHITSDPHNLIVTNWSSVTPVCNWVGVTCGARHLRVTALNLSYSGLQGTIPPQLGNLSFLVDLDFTNNSFHGSLPPELARLRRLKFISFAFNNFNGIIPSWLGSLSLEKFNLVGNQFTGNIPADIFNLSALQKINLGFNRLSGSIPRGIGNLTRLKWISMDNNNFIELPNEIGSLDQLENLYVQSNALRGSIPMAVFNMSSLITLSLYGNDLKGRLPDNLCQNLPRIQELNFGRNMLEGPLPSMFWQCNQLEVLVLGYNNFTGSIPKDIANATQLKEVELSDNNLTGRLPDNMCMDLPHIRMLYFGQNQLEGPLPSVFWSCKQLVDVTFWRNNFHGSISKNIANATQLKYVDFAENNLTGTIPYEIGYLPNLEFLVLDSNNLHGLIPPTIFNMSTIVNIALTDNQLSGSLPTNIGVGLPNLQGLYAWRNKLSGILPKSISNVSQLMVLDAGENLFSGFIPSTLCALPYLERLSLFKNNLTLDATTSEVNILSCLSNIKTLRHLAFSDNPLNANLPISFGNFSTSLEKVFLYNCNLRGTIPGHIGNLSSLIALAIQHNELGGSIPTSLGNLRNLQALDMRGNKLQEHIPNELCQLQNMAALLLAGNQLSGSIPSCLGHLVALRELNLGSNLLNSTIPSTVWGLSNILYLNLSFNYLSGSLSEDLGNLKAVIDIDLSNNHLSGSIPSNIDNLQNLANLSFENNKFEGIIPSSLGKVLSLEYLDLSQNNMSGLIPKSLEALSYLQYLNLSFNRLQGEIPTGGPFRNFSAQSFLSNRELCGAPRLDVPSCKNRTSVAHSTKAGQSKLKYIIPAILSAMAILTSFWIVMLRRRRNMGASINESALSPQVLWRRVSHLELVRATNAFDESNLLGSGGFGSVYKGTLSDGIEVAIKVFNLQLEGAFKSFDIECEMLASVRHRNLIRIISCCSQLDFRAVVLSYMPNGSLDKWLYSLNLCLDIMQRLSIMIDVATALEYLHHGYGTPIVHCDLKPSNILLDEDLNAHVADFGIAKLMSGTDSMTQTITQATIGYMAPEYGMEGIVTRRGDVYSYGIVLMETFTRKKPTDEMFVAEMSLKQWVANSPILDVVDANLLGTEEDDRQFGNKKDCLSSILSLALACSAESPEGRINMQEARASLNKIKIKFSKGAAAGGVAVLNRPLV